MHVQSAATRLLASSAALITEAPTLHGRQQNDVCAYISGSANSPLQCGAGSTCNVGSYGNVQCCSLTCDNNYLGCVSYGGGNVLSVFLSCPSASPACVSILILDVTAGYTVSNYQYTCGPTSTTIVALKTVRTVAAVPGSASTSSPVPILTSTLSVGSSTITAISSSSSSLTQTKSAGAVLVTSTSTVFVQPSTTTSSTSSTSTSTSSGSSGTPIAATIVPAVVVPILGYILLIIFATKQQKRSLLKFLTCGISKRKSSNDDDDNNNAVWQRLNGHNNAATNAQNHNAGRIFNTNIHYHGHNPQQGGFAASPGSYQHDWQQPGRVEELSQLELEDRMH